MNNCDACECPDACKRQGYCIWEQEGISGDYGVSFPAVVIALTMVLIIAVGLYGVMAFIQEVKDLFTTSGAL